MTDAAASVAAFQTTFELFMDDDRYAVPTLHLIAAEDQGGAEAIALRLLCESPHHRGAELCLDGERLTGLGSFAPPRLPLEARGTVSDT